MSVAMHFADLEAVYEKLATAIDAAGAEKAPVYLAKLVLLLSDQIGDSQMVLRAIDDCLHDL